MGRIALFFLILLQSRSPRAEGGTLIYGCCDLDPGPHLLETLDGHAEFRAELLDAFARLRADVIPDHVVARVHALCNDRGLRLLHVDVAEVDAVDSASEALCLVSENDYDVAIIDQGLPDLSGVELIRLLRSEVRTAVLPLLFFTGQDTDGLEDTARHAGADDFVAKPVAPDVIEQRVLALARRSPRSTTAAAS